MFVTPYWPGRGAGMVWSFPGMRDVEHAIRGAWDNMAPAPPTAFLVETPTCRFWVRRRRRPLERELPFRPSVFA